MHILVGDHALLAASKFNWPILAVLAWFVVMVASFFFFVVRPQRQRMVEQQEMLARVKVGDHVITTAGIFGTVTALDEDTATLLIAPNVHVKFARAAILDRREDAE